MTSARSASSDGPDPPHAAEPDTPPDTPPDPGRRLAQARFVAATLATGAIAALTYAPVADPSLWLAVGIAAVAAGWSALPAHTAAVRSLLRGRLEPEIIASLAMAGTIAWALIVATTDRDHSSAFPALLAACALTLALAAGSVLTHAAPPSPLPAPPWWTPALLTITVGATAGWGLIAHTGDEALTVGLAVLIVASPAPLALGSAAALATLRRQGLRLGIRQADHQAPRAAVLLDTIVMDKNGTVTTGELRVLSVDPFDPGHERNIRWFAGAVEQSRDDPIGRALARPLGRGRLSRVEHTPGRGVRGWVDRHPVRVGHPDWLGLEDVPELGTTLGVEIDGRLLGSITLADVVREEAADAVHHLNATGLRPILVSGDTTANAEELAARVGITDVVAEADAERRAETVRSLRRQGHAVALAGNGASLVPAAEHADLLITGDPTLAAPATVLVEDVAADRVSDVVGLLRAAQPRYSAVRLLAYAATAAAVAVAALGIVGLTGAAAIMGGVSLFCAGAGSLPLRT